MEIPVLIEPLSGRGYRAQAMAIADLVAEGATQDEALTRLRQSIQERLAAGAQIVSLTVGVEPHPLLRFAGTWKEGDPLLEEWRQAVEEYRRQVDQDPNAP
jgi:hypothetical protein